MNRIQFPDFTLAGLQLEQPTTNANGQSMKDCGQLWEKFTKGSVASKISERFSDTIYAVYFNYSGAHDDPYYYFIGYQVPEATVSSPGISILHVPGGKYKKITAKGKIPECITKAWMSIWNSKIPRAYITDFEVYDERSLDLENAEVDIYLS